MPALNGDDLLTIEHNGKPVHLRLLEFIDGHSLAHVAHLDRHTVTGLAQLCAHVDVALAGFEHPGLERVLQWDPRHAFALIEHLLPVITDADKRACIAEAAEQAQAYLLPLEASLPTQAIHMDITEYNVVWSRDDHRQWQLQGLIDFGDLVRTWRIAELSVTCAALLHHADGDPFFILSAVQAYHRINPLQSEELLALWPLIVARSAVLVLGSEQQASIEPDNAYIQANLASEWNIFDVATSVPIALMEAAILNAVGEPEAADQEPAFSALLPSLSGQAFTPVDLGVLSEHFVAGNWELGGVDERLLAEAAQRHGLAASRYGEYRLSRTLPDFAKEPDTFALHTELHIPLGTPVHAPFEGRLRLTADGALLLVNAEWSLRLWGVQCDSGSDAAEFDAGAVIGRSSGALIVQLCSEPDVSPPCAVSLAQGAAGVRLRCARIGRCRCVACPARCQFCPFAKILLPGPAADRARLAQPFDRHARSLVSGHAQQCSGAGSRPSAHGPGRGAAVVAAEHQLAFSLRERCRVFRATVEAGACRHGSGVSGQQRYRGE
jgi:Ser/Thr protein kinase RdoA (MazF antagonist)